MGKTNASQEAFARVGALARYGIEHPWQVALYLPESYVDARFAAHPASELQEKIRTPIWLTVTTTPRYGSRSGPPRLQFSVRDEAGDEYRASVFGDTPLWLERLAAPGPRLLVLASASNYLGEHRLTIHQLLPQCYAGRIIPVYPRARIPNGPSAEEVRVLIGKHLRDAVPEAARYISNLLRPVAPIDRLLPLLGAPEWTLELLLRQCHYPHSAEYIEPVLATLKRIAALGSLASAKASRSKAAANPITLHTIEKRIAKMPFAPTNDQRNAIDDIAREMQRTDTACAHVVMGDVGTGKTYVAGTIAAATADHPGRKTVVLFPSLIVAEQAHREFCTWFPDLAITLVTGATGGNEDLSAPILMGTSALLHRKIPRVDVLIVDEQHRFSVQQREQHRAKGTHLIELSATCIPRTQALAKFGHITISEMRETHRPKFIETRLWLAPEGMKALMEETRQVIRQGMPIFIIYPKCERSDGATIDQLDEKTPQPIWLTPTDKPTASKCEGVTAEVTAQDDAGDTYLVSFLEKAGDPQRLMRPGKARRCLATREPGAGVRRLRVHRIMPADSNVEYAQQRWEDQYPGKVITLTGDDDADYKRAAIQAMRDGSKQILICTTVVEVGVDVPGLRHTIIIDPQNYGLVQLHQLRGRVARAGGEGWCHLAAAEGLSLAAKDRLQILIDTTDGFKIAEADLRLRGAGNLHANSTRQHGSDGVFLLGTKIGLDIYEEVFPLLEELSAA